MALRSDLALISEWIQPNSSVLDLGCGDGTLLAHLRDARGTRGYGLEIDDDNIVACVKADINVVQSDLDAGLSDIAADSFDTVIMTQTLQAMHYPDRLLLEMLRVGREGIVTFPNFGHWRARAQLTFGGRMPVSEFLPYEWYNTPNIHLCTFPDFERLCDKLNIEILQRSVVDSEHRTGFGNQLLPTLFGEIAIYRFKVK